MTSVKRLGWIAAGYAAAAAVAVALLSIRYRFIDPAVVSASSGMYAGGDLIGFVLIAGVLSLPSTYFLVRMAIEASPRVLAAILLALAATAGPSLWLVANLSSSKSYHFPGIVNELLGLALVFFFLPRVVAMPVVLVVLGFAFLMIREERARLMLGCALALEAAPLLVLALHFARAFSPP